GGVPLDAVNVVSLSDEWLRELVRKVAGDVLEGSIEAAIGKVLERGAFAALLRELEDLTSLRGAPEGLYLMTRAGVGPRLSLEDGRKDWSRALVLVHG